MIRYEEFNLQHKSSMSQVPLYAGPDPHHCVPLLSMQVRRLSGIRAVQKAGRSKC